MFGFLSRNRNRKPGSSVYPVILAKALCPSEEFRDSRGWFEVCLARPANLPIPPSFGLPILLETGREEVTDIACNLAGKVFVTLAPMVLPYPWIREGVSIEIWANAIRAFRDTGWQVSSAKPAPVAEVVRRLYAETAEEGNNRG